MDASVEHPQGSRVTVLPIVIALILTFTAIPFELRPPAWSAVEFSWDRGDLIRNVIFFLPLGLFSRRGLAATCLLGAVVSTCAEFFQVFSATRHPALADIVTNIAGTALGWLVSGRVPHTIALTRMVRLGSVGGGLLLSLAMIPRNVRTDISNWDPNFEMKVGADAKLEQAWKGEVRGVDVRAGAMTADEIARLAARGVEEVPMARPTNAGKRFREIVEAGQVTILFWGSTADLDQKGPVRIVAWAGEEFDSNMTLGQDGPRLVFRVRTVANGANGGRQETRTGPLLEAGRLFFFAGTYDGKIARVFIDGVEVARNDLSVRFPLSFLPGLGCALMSGFLLSVGGQRWQLTVLVVVGLLAAGATEWGRVAAVDPLRFASLFVIGVVVAQASVRQMKNPRDLRHEGSD